MAKLRGIQGVAIILILPVCLVASCTSDPVDDGGSGGSPTDGSGGTASGGSASGGVDAGGGLGGTESCFQADQDGVDCGTCELSVDEFCSTANCSIHEDLTCLEDGVFNRSFQRGCGYLRREQYGDVQDEWLTIWEERSGELVYHYFSGGSSVGCLPETIVGEEPECDSYEDACENGLGGAGGMGGGP